MENNVRYVLFNRDKKEIYRKNAHLRSFYANL